jgi:ABC-type sulfate transport system permease subunit
MSEVLIIIVGGYIVFSLILIPLQYRYVEQMEKRRKNNEKQGISQDEMMENMKFEEQVLHANVQGNMIFILANIFATIIYKVKHRGKMVR